MSGCLFARHALLPQGWRRDVLLEWDAAGDLTAVTESAVAPAGVEVAQYVLPGMVNLHSHAFQRALGGMTEVAGDEVNHVADSFWTWRELMYRFARHITPEQMEAIAAQLFAECLRALERHLGAPLMTGELQIIASLYSLGVMPSQSLQAKTDTDRQGADDPCQPIPLNAEHRQR